MGEHRESLSMLAALARCMLLAGIFVCSVLSASAQPLQGRVETQGPAGDVFAHNTALDPLNGAPQTTPTALGPGGSRCVPLSPSWQLVRQIGNTCYWYAPFQQPLQGYIIAPMPQVAAIERQGGRCGVNPFNVNVTAVCKLSATANIPGNPGPNLNNPPNLRQPQPPAPRPPIGIQEPSSTGCDVLGALAPPVFVQYAPTTNNTDLWVKPGSYRTRARGYDGAFVGEIRTVTVTLGKGALLNSNPMKNLILEAPFKGVDCTFPMSPDRIVAKRVPRMGLGNQPGYTQETVAQYKIGSQIVQFNKLTNSQGYDVYYLMPGQRPKSELWVTPGWENLLQ